LISYQRKEFDTLKNIELKENGNQIDVVENNKKEFVKAMAYAKMGREIEKQTEALMFGISEIIPTNAFSLITEQDLGVRLAGVPSINGFLYIFYIDFDFLIVDEMQKYVVYSKYDQNQDIPKWLFEILREYDENMKAKFLFYTLGLQIPKIHLFDKFKIGCFRVPIGGFKAFPLKIELTSDVKYLPLGHTCFNQIDIPPYPSKVVLKEKLTLAITEGSGSGFFVG